MIAVRDRLDEFGDAAVGVVFFDATDRLGEYRTTFDIPDRIALLADPDRTAYRAYAIGRGPWWRVWGPKTFAAYAALVGRGRRYRRHERGADTLQLGGDVVIGADGRLAYVFQPPDPDSRPPVDDLVAALTRA